MKDLASGDPGPAPAEVRRARLRALLAEEGFVRVAPAADELGVSQVTIRSDLEALEVAGVLRRVHGGAMPVVRAREEAVERAESRHARVLRAIGRRAALQVESGSTLALDVGSTTLAVARALVARPELRDVTIVTNGLAIALALEPAVPRFDVIVTGGTLRPLQHSLVAPGALAGLAGLRVELALLGASAVADDGEVSNVNLPEAEVKRALLDSADRAILVASGSKAGARHLAPVAPLERFNRVVTGGPDGERLAAIARARGVAVEVAGP